MSTYSGPIDQADAHATELSVAPVASQCANCQVPLASDQRYCVECGMRRGRPRFAPGQAFIPAPGAPQEPVDPPPPARPRLSPAATLVAGVATLLLAMGVGVLIGNSGRTSAEGPQVITVGGAVGGSTVASGGTAAATTPQTPVSNTKKRAHKTTKEDLKAASKAATKVLGTAAPKKPIVKVGDKCSRGTAGCKDGKFEGNFFGP